MVEGEEPECVSTLHIRPGGSSVAAAGGRDACSLKLRHSNASLAQTKAVHQTLDEEGGPLAVEVTGLQRQELNARYSARQDVILHGRRTYWTREANGAASRLFLAWQKSLGRWALCERPGAVGGRSPPDSEELERSPWQAFQLESSGVQAWAWVQLLEPGRWMERREAGWATTEAVQVSPATPQPMPALRPPVSDSRPLSVELAGFRRLELNARYSQRADVPLQGRASYWDTTGRLFLYWQSTLKRWAICSKRALDLARQGQCPGCACQLDLVHFTAPSRWVEYADGVWAPSPVEVTSVVPAPVEEAAATGPAAASGWSGGGSTAPAAGPQALAAAFVQATLEKGPAKANTSS